MNGEADAVDSRSDAELIAAIRSGDIEASGQLWQRHHLAATRLARQLTAASEADDLVSDGFARVLSAIRGGGGPDGAFRPYLFSTMRRANIDNTRRYWSRVNLTGTDHDLDVGSVSSAADIAEEIGEQTAAWRAWASLPASSRTVLWHLIIEEESPSEIAPMLGTTPNGVSSRGARARERLRQAFLQQHVRDATDPACVDVRSRLGEYGRNAASAQVREAIEEHLAGCEECARAARDIAELNLTLRSAIAPVVLGGPGIAHSYLSGAAGHTAAAALLWRASRRQVGAHTPAALVGIAVATVAVVGSLVAVALLTAGRSPGRPEGDAPIPPSTAQRVASDSVTPTWLGMARAGRPTQKPVHAVGSTGSSVAPTLGRSTPPVPQPSAAPTQNPPSSHARSAPAHPPTPPPAPSRTPSPTVSPTSSPTSVPPVVTRHASLQLILNSPSVAGTLTLKLPPGWHVDSIGAPAGVTCGGVGGQVGRCSLLAMPTGSYPFTVVASGPNGGTPPAVHIDYLDGANHISADYPLVGP